MDNGAEVGWPGFEQASSPAQLVPGSQRGNSPRLERLTDLRTEPHPSRETPSSSLVMYKCFTYEQEKTTHLLISSQILGWKPFYAPHHIPYLVLLSSDVGWYDCQQGIQTTESQTTGLNCLPK